MVNMQLKCRITKRFPESSQMIIHHTSVEKGEIHALLENESSKSHSDECSVQPVSSRKRARSQDGRKLNQRSKRCNDLSRNEYNSIAQIGRMLQRFPDNIAYILVLRPQKTVSFRKRARKGYGPFEKIWSFCDRMPLSGIPQ